MRLTLDPVPPADRTGLIRYPVALDGVRIAVLQLPATLGPRDIECLVLFIVGLADEADAAAGDDDPPWNLDPAEAPP